MYVITNHYIIIFLNVHKFVVNFTTWIEDNLNDVEEIEYNNLFQDIGFIFFVACDCIKDIFM